MGQLEEQVEQLTRGCVDVITKESLVEKLALGRPLRVKAGFDPTAPDLHLGHTVLLNKLRQFQRLGHEICFVVGDFTAMIGDPTGKNKTRPPLSAEAVAANARTYQAQVFKVLDPDKTRVLFNSEWMASKTAADLIALAAKQTVARLLEREDFKRRYQAEQAIALHELLYPALQGADSVQLQADVELGGTDQTFNLLMGRACQRDAGQAQQVVLTMPLLEGLDGVKKMSKSVGNTIAIEASAPDMFAQLMSISDVLMWRYIELLSEAVPAQIDAWRVTVEQGKNPMAIKVDFAKEIVTRFHDAAQAEQAHQDFVQRFKHQQLPEDLPLMSLPALTAEGLPIANLLQQAGLVSSTSEALRMIRQGAVRVGGEKVSDTKLCVPIASTSAAGDIYQVGKRRYARVIVTKA